MRLIDADRLIQGLYVIRDRETGIPRSLANWFLSMVDETPTIQPQGIDKDRLIELLNTDMSGCDGDFAEEMAEIIIANMQQPTTDGWIPCSERLPKENGKYFVTMWDEIIGPYTTEWHFYNGKFMPFIYHTNRKVLAWQPLPPAYKEREEE